MPRRNGRVVECTGLENQRTARYRGFESLFLRHQNPAVKTVGFFIFQTSSLLVSVGKRKITDFALAKWDFSEANPFWDARSEAEGILVYV